MRRMFRWLSMAIAAGLLVVAPAFAQGLAVGDKAPDFKLQGSDGKTYSLADLNGRAVVLAWFPKAFTGG